MAALERYFREHPDRKKIDLARFAGVTPSRISQVCNGARPGLALACRIQEWTDGAVKAADLEPSHAPENSGAPEMDGLFHREEVP